MAELSGKRVVILLETLYNDLEFWYAKLRLQEAGAEVLTAAPQAKAVYTSKFGLPATSDLSFKQALDQSFDGVLIPGGYAPDHIRRSPEALELVRRLFAAGKLVAHVCHAGWVPASAGILSGMTTTSFFAIKDDLIHAGAKWVDEPVVVDRNLISSRTPADLTFWLPAIIAFLRK